jgi:hypothetical protein
MTTQIAAACQNYFLNLKLVDIISGIGQINFFAVFSHLSLFAEKVTTAQIPTAKN